jgi:hypothetical protein
MPPFKDGTSLNKLRRRRDGSIVQYIRIRSGPQRGQYVHRMILEAKLGRKLQEDEEGDHIDGDTLNNDPGNLQVLHTVAYARETRRRHNGGTRPITRPGEPVAPAVDAG